MAYTTTYIGVTSMGGSGNNGCVTRFEYTSTSEFLLGADVLYGIYLTTTKTWLTIGY